METKSLIDLIEYLCRPAQIVRTGIWLMPDEALGKEEEIIISLRRACDAIDMRQAVVKRRPEGTQVAGIRLDRIQEWIDSILKEDITTDCGVLYHMELLLAYLPAAERDQVWELLKTTIRRRSKALVIALPKRALGILLKENMADDWRAQGRLFESQ